MYLIFVKLTKLNERFLKKKLYIYYNIDRLIKIKCMHNNTFLNT